MDQLRGTLKAFSINAPQDFISCMPDDVITNIMDRLPIQYAVRTSILSREWRFKWTLLTQLLFGSEFAEYLDNLNRKENFNGMNLSRILFHLKGPITKFSLFFHDISDVEDVNHSIMSLSKKGIKELAIYNVKDPELVLPTYLYSCKQLEHLTLFRCCFPHPLFFQGFPNLLSLDLSYVTFDGNTFKNFANQCPLLETLKIRNFCTVGNVKLCQISKLGNLKFLSLQLPMLENMTMITASSIFQLLCCVRKLQELHLDFRYFKFLAEAGGGRKVPGDFQCLKTLVLWNVDFSDDTMVSFVYEMICRSLNLLTLYINVHGKKIDVQNPKLCSSDLEVSTTGQLQLERVTFTSFTGSENEVGLLKSILASSCSLKKIIISPASTSVFGDDHGKLMFSKKLLKLHRASVAPEIYVE